MYLTKIDMRLSSPAVRAALRDAQKMHQLTAGLFKNSRQDADVLYRVRVKGSDVSVYLYSDIPVEPGGLQLGMSLAGERDLSAWLESMEAGQIWGFELLTMPFKKVSGGTGKNSRRRVLRSREERTAWFERKAAQNGFALLDVQERTGEKLTGSHPEDKGGRLYLGSYCYSGFLRVTDAEAFRCAVRQGIGPGKSYGLGMLLLKR